MKHLSRFDIEAIADKYVQAYMALPDVRNTQIYRIDPELLLEKVLGLNVEYQHLSYDGSILGMTSFTEMGVQVFEDDDNEAFFFLDGKTVLVEKDLNFDSKLKGRKNFTLMHEGSHQIFKMLFPNDYGVTQKSAGVHYYKANSERNKPISDWEEWQANTLGAAILLPENLIKQGMYLFSLGEKIECLNKIYFPGVYKRFDALINSITNDSILPYCVLAFPLENIFSFSILSKLIFSRLIFSNSYINSERSQVCANSSLNVFK